jgi:hypothetical protein
MNKEECFLSYVNDSLLKDTSLKVIYSKDLSKIKSNIKGYFLSSSFEEYNSYFKVIQEKRYFIEEYNYKNKVKIIVKESERPLQHMDENYIKIDFSSDNKFDLLDFVKSLELELDENKIIEN